ncbi:hypothetical protein NPX13_g4266 [Xylaria arbuscula]|uniref:beta-glucosidase n=1 Tax=Xylaria arbuscula TaxID=114810 RepID=A0A9W8NGD4_9PEZI|nr:hypothetical protein NPX13_g4266 [Xylaria arbuscula]
MEDGGAVDLRWRALFGSIRGTPATPLSLTWGKHGPEADSARSLSRRAAPRLSRHHETPCKSSHPSICREARRKRANLQSSPPWGNENKVVDALRHLLLRMLPDLAESQGVGSLQECPPQRRMGKPSIARSRRPKDRDSCQAIVVLFRVCTMRFQSLAAALSAASAAIAVPTDASLEKRALTWDEAYAKANASLSKLSSSDKINLVTGVGWGKGACVGNTPAVSSIGYPSLCLQDGPLGVRYAKGVNAFTPGIQAASTWDRALIRERGQFMGEETRGVGVHVLLGPVAGPLGNRHG